MALIKCPECSQEVSDKAASCPNCGVGIVAVKETKAAGAPLTTTQLTSKKIKIQILLSIFIIIFGMVITAINYPVVGILTILGGIVWFIITKIRKWWHHD